MKNIELKVEYPDLVHAERVARRVGAKLHWRRQQIDTYFQVSRGRLKIREVRPSPEAGQSSATAASPDRPLSLAGQHAQAELISYFRPDGTDLRPSRFQRLPLGDPRMLAAMLTAHWGVLITVSKLRTLYLLENVRIHLDQVAGLGNFLEFEGMIRTDEDVAGTEARLHMLREAFAIDEEMLVATSYSDLLHDKKQLGGLD